MFEDSTGSVHKESQPIKDHASFWLNQKWLLAIVALVVALLLLAVFMFLVLKKPNSSNTVVTPVDVATSTEPVASSSSMLPTNPLVPSDPNNQNNDLSNVKAENLSFSQFYVPLDDKPVLNVDKLKLPMQVKSEVDNYYDFSRKIDLTDAQVNELNKNGFILADNTLTKDNNFYGAYSALNNQGIPEIVTSDFLLYYYQNSMKEVFADVKSNTFYQDLWLINKGLFDIASNRYKKTKAKVGLANDPVLEGQRLEAAYFATALELLKPKSEQTKAFGLNEENKFTDQDLITYDFTLPDYLVDDVKKEEALIYAANEVKKSPVFRYTRDYAVFKMPNGVDKNSKLGNFQLADIWANSEFPLYYKNEKCPNCLLDKNDWLINFITNSYVAKDFSDNQELKNRWARVYKVLSYFSGLRKDLTYLQFQNALIDSYGGDYQLENIFSAENGLDKAMTTAVKLQSVIEKKYTFSDIEGGYDRADSKVKPLIGMRLLQEDYWPDGYILKQLVSPFVGNYTKDANKVQSGGLNTTACSLNGSRVLKRCSAIGLDIVNLYNPILRNNYFNENSSYDNYSSQSRMLADQLNNFTADSWHNSNYWSIMSLNKKTLLGQPGLSGPISTLGDAWQLKNINTALGAWVNLKLPADDLRINVEESRSLISNSEANTYVEPNLALINDLMANTKMLSQMLVALKITKDVDMASKKLTEFSDDLIRVKQAAIKELQGENLDSESQLAILNIIKRYSVVNEQNKTIILHFDAKNSIEQINGVKLLISVYQLKGRKIMVAGPIFNYSER